VLGVTLLLDVLLPKAFGGAAWLRWVPPANLVIWSGAAAATASVHRMRHEWREQHRPVEVLREDSYQGPYQQPPAGPDR
jgi:hypothetical protein